MQYFCPVATASLCLVAVTCPFSNLSLKIRASKGVISHQSITALGFLLTNWYDLLIIIVSRDFHSSSKTSVSKR